jgi:excisionase family DNA binding protein
MRGRFTKSEAAKRLKISRRTVIRYVKAGRITEDRRGRVRLDELGKVVARSSYKRMARLCRYPRKIRIKSSPFNSRTKIYRPHPALGGLTPYQYAVRRRRRDIREEIEDLRREELALGHTARGVLARLPLIATLNVARRTYHTAEKVGGTISK